MQHLPINIIVTGAGGQLGQALQKAAPAHAGLQFHFFGSAETDITNKESIDAVFKAIKPQYCINTAAYTAVDKAESEPEKAYDINVTGAKNLAEACNDYNATLIHISTDFVFNGEGKKPYTEEDEPNPTSVYGKTKLEGEKAIAQVCYQYYIIRTAWVYSEFANNFMKTMLRLAADRTSLSVVNDQEGTPTNANDLAEALLHIIEHDNKAYGIYHYSNEGETTWYGFAAGIFELNNVLINLQPIPSADYPTPAKRPAYSVLDKSKIKQTFGLFVPDWVSSLKKCSENAKHSHNNTVL
ncbi:dTDP-4-dehydrorhamnose reductase [Flavobacterium sp. RHBU_3]|uniref:dTDP-4-dehydrorhamnose reductase n=1 Tax=Flavobacterium sp. RHBU_3 TaxID=3391184 RepID=UPI003985398F